MASQSIDNIETNDMNFKHLETTKDIVISLKNEFGDPQRPDATHRWSAKVSDGTNYVGDYAVKIDGASLIVDSEDFTKLQIGSYQLEVWEEWIDPDGTQQRSIYPSPRQTIPFQIYANITDQAGKEIKEIGFQDVVDQAVMNIGMNYVFKVNTVGPDDTATVVQATSDGKNYVTFNIPQGKTGEQGFRGPDGKAFHIQQTFASVKEMEASQGKGFEDGDFALITSKVDDPDNSKLYAWADAAKKFTYMNDLSGATGIQGPAGPAPTLHVTKVTSLPSNEAPTFNLVPVSDGNYNVEVGIPKGDKGDTGSAGPQGKSAYQVWLDNGNTGNETNFLSSLKGKDVDLSLYLSKEEAQKDYATKDSVKAIALDTAKRTLTIGDQVINIPDSVDLSPYAKTSDVPQVVYDADKRTLTINGTKVDLPANVDLTNYYTKSEVDQHLAKVTAGSQVDLSGYLTTADANKTYQTKADASSQNSNLQTEINKKADATALADYVPTSQVDTLKGPKGDPGESAYAIWKDAGNTGTEAQFLASLKGPQGPAGTTPTLHVTKVTTVPNGGQPSFTVTPVGNGNYNIEIGLPKGNKGDKGDDAVINVISQAEYDALTDKTGVYFIEG